MVVYEDESWLQPETATLELLPQVAHRGEDSKTKPWPLGKNKNALLFVS